MTKTYQNTMIKDRKNKKPKNQKPKPKTKNQKPKNQKTKKKRKTKKIKKTKKTKTCICGAFVVFPKRICVGDDDHEDSIINE